MGGSGAARAHCGLRSRPATAAGSRIDGDCDRGIQYPARLELPELLLQLLQLSLAENLRECLCLLWQLQGLLQVRAPSGLQLSRLSVIPGEWGGPRDWLLRRGLWGEFAERECARFEPLNLVGRRCPGAGLRTAQPYPSGGSWGEISEHKSARCEPMNR